MRCGVLVSLSNYIQSEVYNRMTDAHMFLQFIESKSPGTKQDTTFEQNVQENVAK